jgi:hypothetical protein
MTNRREFLQSSVSFSALPLTSGLLPPGAYAAMGNDMALYKTIFDDRYEEGRIFANTLSGPGVPTHALKDGDVTEVYDELDLQWRKKPVAIAGLTQFGPMFVLEQLGNARRMRVALRVEHQVRADGMLAHVMTGPPETVLLAERLRLRGIEWPGLFAAVLCHCRADCAAPVSHTMAMPGVKPEFARRTSPPPGSTTTPESVIHYYSTAAVQEGHPVPWDGPLFSWVIVPDEPRLDAAGRIAIATT